MTKLNPEGLLSAGGVMSVHPVPFHTLMEPVALRLLGEPNRARSKAEEPRGSRQERISVCRSRGSFATRSSPGSIYSISNSTSGAQSRCHLTTTPSSRA